MDLQSYFNHKNKLYHLLLEFIDDDSNDDEAFELLANQIDLQQFGQNRDEMTEFIRLLNKISKNHFRKKSLFPKIEKIISYLQEYIKQTFSNYEIFENFVNNWPIILFLFQNKIVDVDEEIEKFISANYLCKQFFMPETETENFERNRQIGENDSDLCSLIREDSIKEFIVYVNQRNMSLLDDIQTSIFETNSFLIEREKTTLIEYAAFFGSIQIFQYLCINNVPLTSSLWLFAIHGRSAEIINFLVENHVNPPNDSYEKCLEESIKCHHNEIANYIRDNFIKDEAEDVFNGNIIAYGYHYSNYEYIPTNLDSKFTLFYLCAYGYTNLVKHFMKTKKFDINEKVVFNNQYFF